MKKLLVVAIATSFISAGALATSAAFAYHLTLNIHTPTSNFLVSEVATRSGSGLWGPLGKIHYPSTLYNVHVNHNEGFTVSNEGIIGSYDVWVNKGSCHLHISGGSGNGHKFYHCSGANKPSISFINHHGGWGPIANVTYH